VNEEDYSKCKITKILDLSNNILVDMILNLDSAELANKLHTMTESKRNHPIFHTLFQRIVELNSNGTIARMTYENRVAIETFFRFKISDMQMLLNRMTQANIK
jgi:hypothetical protein